jgi:hypothetical protein
MEVESMIKSTICSSINDLQVISQAGQSSFEQWHPGDFGLTILK